MSFYLSWKSGYPCLMMWCRNECFPGCKIVDQEGSVGLQNETCWLILTDPNFPEKRFKKSSQLKKKLGKKMKGTKKRQPWEMHWHRSHRYVNSYGNFTSQLVGRCWDPQSLPSASGGNAWNQQMPALEVPITTTLRGTDLIQMFVSAWNV